MPTIRLIDGKLTKIENPLQYALDKGDFLTGFKNEKEVKSQANNWFKLLKNKIHMSFDKIKIDNSKKIIKNSEINKKLQKRAQLKIKVNKEENLVKKHSIED